MLKNNYLPFDQLPRAESLPFAPLPRAGLWRVVLGRIALWLILAALLQCWNALPPGRFVRFDSIWLWLWPVLLATLILPFLEWRYRLLAVREHDLVLQEGWWLRRMRAQPLSRVLQVQLNQNLLQRWLGVATLDLYGAGKKNTRMRLPDLPLEHALQLRDHVLRHHVTHGSPDGGHPASAVQPPSAAPASAPVPSPAPTTASGGQP